MTWRLKRAWLSGGCTSSPTAKPTIASLLGLGIEIPNYSTLSRHSRLLRKKLRIPKPASNQSIHPPIHLMIDSSFSYWRHYPDGTGQPFQAILAVVEVPADRLEFVVVQD